ncbi:MAG: TerB family tellurite resistance protein [Myxococcales bacterium]|nr:TerB family tellurite resistance protein [Myxococcales bacterium]
MKFVCSFAWADLEIQDEERTLVGNMIERLDLQEDRKQIEGWLKHPPPPEEVDPTEVPREHRQLFLAAVREMVAADDKVDPAEAEALELFEQLMI